MEEFLALLRNQFDGACASGRGADEARLAGALHPDRHIGNVRLGRARHQGRRADQADQAPMPPRRWPSTCILESVHKFLKFPMNIIRPSNAYCPGQLLHRVIPKAIWCGLTGNKLPLHGGGRAEKSYIHARDLGRAIHLVAEKAPLGRDLQCRPEQSDLDPRGGRALRQGARHAVRAAVRGDRRPARSGLRATGSTQPASRRASAGSRRSAGTRASPRWWLGARSICRPIRDWPTDYVLRA